MRQRKIMTPISQTPSKKCTCDESLCIANRARKRLRESPYVALRHVQCRCAGGVLTLTGEAPTYYTKQIAQTILQDLENVSQIDNRIVVRDWNSVEDSDD